MDGFLKCIYMHKYLCLIIMLQMWKLNWFIDMNESVCESNRRTYVWSILICVKHNEGMEIARLKFYLILQGNNLKVVWFYRALNSHFVEIDYFIS